MGTALVTGASSGIGKEMARLLDDAGHSLVLVARSTAALDELAGSLRDAKVITADLGTADGPAAVADAVDEVDILVNNAGFGECGDFARSDQVSALEMIAVNCSALTALTGSFLPGMLERGSGKVLNIASTAAFQPGPSMAVYYASKAYVLSFSEAVAEEVRGSGVSVTAFCPGAFASGFQEVAKAGNTRLVKGRSLPSAATIAGQAIAAMNRGDVVRVPGLMNKIGASSIRFTPRPISRRIVHYIQAEA